MQVDEITAEGRAKIIAMPWEEAMVDCATEIEALRVQYSKISAKEKTDFEEFFKNTRLLETIQVQPTFKNPVFKEGKDGVFERVMSRREELEWNVDACAVDVENASRFLCKAIEAEVRAQIALDEYNAAHNDQDPE